MSEWTPNYRPSNGSEGDIFEHKHCTGCTVNTDECDIMIAALFGEAPDEWEMRRTPDGYETRCTARTVAP